jgi:hypothetical protein
LLVEKAAHDEGIEVVERGKDIGFGSVNVEWDNLDAALLQIGYIGLLKRRGSNEGRDVLQSDVLNKHREVNARSVRTHEILNRVEQSVNDGATVLAGSS